MARADMNSLAARDVTPLPPREPAAASTPPAAAPAREEAATARITFDVTPELRRAFKVWVANNDTSVKDELTAYIERRLRGE